MPPGDVRGSGTSVTSTGNANNPGAPTELMHLADEVPASSAMSLRSADRLLDDVRVAGVRGFSNQSTCMPSLRKCCGDEHVASDPAAALLVDEGWEATVGMLELACPRVRAVPCARS